MEKILAQQLVTNLIWVSSMLWQQKLVNAILGCMHHRSMVSKSQAVIVPLRSAFVKSQLASLCFKTTSNKNSFREVQQGWLGHKKCNFKKRNIHRRKYTEGKWSRLFSIIPAGRTQNNEIQLLESRFRFDDQKRFVTVEQSMEEVSGCVQRDALQSSLWDFCTEDGVNLMAWRALFNSRILRFNVKVTSHSSYFLS